MRLSTFGLLQLIVAFALCASSRASYRAAVLEYSPILQDTIGQVSRDVAISIMEKNLVSIEGFVGTAAASGAQIIVLPEYGLNGPVFRTRDEAFSYLEPIPTQGALPCGNSTIQVASPISTRLSCIAKKYNIIVVANFGDVQYCNNVTEAICPSDGRFQYNTQVAFAEDGSILNKYWKEHLYYEFHFDTPINQAPKFFDTAFGVRFGMFICFDIIFARPGLDLMRSLGVEHFVYSTWWVNTPPLMTATQIQQGWSRFFNVSLLAANSGKNWYNSGSGIFATGNIISSQYNPSKSPANFLLMGEVPTISSRPPQTQELGLSTPFSSGPSSGLDLKYTALNDTMQPGTYFFQLSVSGLSCRARVELTDRSAFKNMFFYAASGDLTPLFPSKACGLIKCPTLDLSQCFTLVPKNIPPSSAEALFSSLDLTAEFSFVNLSATSVVAMTATSKGMLLPDGSTILQQVSDRQRESPTITYRLKSTSSCCDKTPILNWTLFVRDLNTKHFEAMSQTRNTSRGLG